MAVTCPQVEIFCYALSASDGSEWRQRIEREAEHFLDVSAWPVPDIAGRIAADGIHIAVNLNGYTKVCVCWAHARAAAAAAPLCSYSSCMLRETACAAPPQLSCVPVMGSHGLLGGGAVAEYADN